MQKFKHNNTNIWIWKICLLKIYLTKSWWLQAGLQQRDDLDWKKKITRENFLNSQNFALSKFFMLLKLSSRLCLMKKVEALFIGEDSDLKFYWICNLEKVWNPSRVETVRYWSLQRENFFSLSKTWKEKNSLYFPILHVACKVVESRKILLFTTIHDFWCSVHAGVFF